MMLGMAASSSVRKAKGPRKRLGHISVGKAATPTASGTASKSERNEETNVPYTKGRALKWPLTGSQYEGRPVAGSIEPLQKNCRPKLLQARSERRTSSQAIRATMAKILKAHSTISA